MRFDPSAPADAILAELRRDAERSFGSERLQDIAPFLELTAAALARLGEAALEPFGDVPDLLACGGPRA